MTIFLKYLYTDLNCVVLFQRNKKLLFSTCVKSRYFCRANFKAKNTLFDYFNHILIHPYIG